jgi:hypothetical protein
LLNRLRLPAAAPELCEGRRLRCGGICRHGYRRACSKVLIFTLNDYSAAIAAGQGSAVMTSSPIQFLEH